MVINVATVTFILASAITRCYAPIPDADKPLTRNLAADELCVLAGGATAPVDGKGLAAADYTITALPANSVDPHKNFIVTFKVKDCANVKTYKTVQGQPQPTIQECIIDCEKHKGWVITECKQNGGALTQIVALEKVERGGTIRTPFHAWHDKDKIKFDLTCHNWSQATISWQKL